MAISDGFKGHTAAIVMMSVLCLSPARVVFSGELGLVRAIGLSETGPIYFSNPYDLDWDASGQAYVLSGGDSRVVVFSQDWQYLRAFAGEGEAPGELNRPMELSVVGPQIWVKVPRGAEVFEASGDYAGLVRMGTEITSLAYSNEKLYGTANSGAGVGVELGLDGATRSAFGPKPPQLRALANFLERRVGWPCRQVTGLARCSIRLMVVPGLATKILRASRKLTLGSGVEKIQAMGISRRLFWTLALTQRVGTTLRTLTGQIRRGTSFTMTRAGGRTVGGRYLQRL
jgi:hypothetical protein